MSKKKKQYQTVVITLSNGSTVYFTGSAQVPTDTDLTIADIKFTVPKDLPDDYAFETLKRESTDA